MDNVILRGATEKDIPFLAKAIVEAEKAGTDKLPYSTIFGLSSEESEKYIAKMLLEEVDGCELSTSSFLIAEIDGKYAGAASAWIEGCEGMPSNILKGNLLNFILPRKCIEKAISVKSIISELHIDYQFETMQFGSGYVVEKYRGRNLFSFLKIELLKRLMKSNPKVSEGYVQIFASNTPAIRVNEKLGFQIVKTLESSNSEILKYLPSNRKILMKKYL